MKALVVGGAGYIGGYLVNKLQQQMPDVVVYDNLLYEDRYLKDVDFIRGDIRDTGKLVEAAEDCDVVILAAALVGDPACAVDKMLTHDINFKAIKDACLALPKNKHVIFLSTCSVYGAQNDLLDETSPTDPLSDYAVTKLKAEKYVEERGGTIFRLGTVFGLGDTHSRIRLDLVVNVLTLNAITYGKITVNGGDQWRPIISVKDVAGYICEACKGVSRAGIYILARENTTIKNLGEKVVSLIPDTDIEYTDISFQDARNYKVTTDKVDNAFIYMPRYSVDDEVHEMKSLFTEQRIKDPSNSLYSNGKYLTELRKVTSF